jgi:hypothetical protein
VLSDSTFPQSIKVFVFQHILFTEQLHDLEGAANEFIVSRFEIKKDVEDLRER